METEWLVAWFDGRSQQVPPHVQERLKIVGFIDGVNLTDAGRCWLQARGRINKVSLAVRLHEGARQDDLRSGTPASRARVAPSDTHPPDRKTAFLGCGVVSR